MFAQKGWIELYTQIQYNLIDPGLNNRKQLNFDKSITAKVFFFLKMWYEIMQTILETYTILDFVASFTPYKNLCLNFHNSIALTKEIDCQM